MILIKQMSLCFWMLLKYFGMYRYSGKLKKCHRHYNFKTRILCMSLKKIPTSHRCIIIWFEWQYTIHVTIPFLQHIH